MKFKILFFFAGLSSGLQPKHGAYYWHCKVLTTAGVSMYSGLCIHAESWSPTSTRRRRWPRTMDWPSTCCSQCCCAHCRCVPLCALLTNHYLPGHLQGFNPVYPPVNPAYPPPGPAMVPPAQPPQWNGPPAGPYPPGPEAPMVCFWIFGLSFCLSWNGNSKEGLTGLGHGVALYHSIEYCNICPICATFHIIFFNHK